jgi:hypothetical protein
MNGKHPAKTLGFWHSPKKPQTLIQNDITRFKSEDAGSKHRGKFR